MTWDLAEVITERKQPTTEVVVHLNEFASHAKVQIEKALATERDADKVAELEKALEEAEIDLGASKYTITLEALPSRFRKDINAEVNREFPYRRGPLGGLANDDPTQERIERENNLMFAAMVRDVKNPRDESKTDWSREEAIQFVSALPAKAQQTVDNAMRELHQDAEKFTADVKNPNL
jgi:hypothetical protein